MATAGFQNSTGFSGGDSGVSDTKDDVQAERNHDPASGGLFGIDFSRHDDLKEMLDGNDEKRKLEAMKRIIGMVAKGKDASGLFPAVVKNVACKNLEVKKLVYVYLTRYAEEQQDLALLSISTFQRSMKDPNQLIRASALRVLSSIRVPVIVPIMMLAIKDGVSDMSPYVRKAAAHAIPKLYSVDPEQKEELVQFLEKLIADKTTLVIGSAIQAFEEICPERIDLIHKSFRKLCAVLADVEEWGQIIIINMLTRYARSQFLNPNTELATEQSIEVQEKAFYSSNEESESDDEAKSPSKPVYIMDPDHRLLLRSAKPLLNSRNAAVVMAVVQLYYHCAPKAEVNLVARALIRLLRSHKEVQYIILSSIATMSLNRRGMFEPHLKSFFVRVNDPIQVKLLKVEILTSLATEGNVSVMMREFQQYVGSSEKEFSAATIQCIGKIAGRISDITDACLGGLITLLSNKDEVVVGESIVVIKKLLQMKPHGHKDIITHLAHMVDNITVPNARGSILWLIGEYCDKIPKIAPDVLRKMAKSFINEDDIVKLQIMNLAAKLCVTNTKQTQLLCQYVLNLAKYDQSYDIRDRARFLRALIFPGETMGALAKRAKKILLVAKPAPVLDSKYKERDQYQLGSLSHVINNRAHGYTELPDWPAVAPPSSVRDVELPPITPATKHAQHKNKQDGKPQEGFYSSNEDGEEEEDGSEEESDEEESEEEDSGEEQESEEDESEEGSSKGDVSEDKEDSEVSQGSGDESSSEEESGSDSAEEEEESEEEDSTSSEEEPVQKSKTVGNKPASSTAVGGNSSLSGKKDSELLLDLLDFDPGSTGGASLSGSTLQPLTPAMAGLSLTKPASTVLVSTPLFIPTTSHELLNRMSSDGLTATYRFTRSPYSYSSKMVDVELTFINGSDAVISNIRLGERKLQGGLQLHEFPALSKLEIGASICVHMGIDFNDTLQPATFELLTAQRSFKVKVEAPAGELLCPLSIIEKEFNIRQGKLTGMNETTSTLGTGPISPSDLHKAIIQVANVARVESGGTKTQLYAAQTVSNRCDVLIRLSNDDHQTVITVNSEKIVVGSMLVKDLKVALQTQSAT